jgi:hypothetical protein
MLTGSHKDGGSKPPIRKLTRIARFHSVRLDLVNASDANGLEEVDQIVGRPRRK